MDALNVTIPQVLWNSEDINAAAVTAVPLLRARIGPGTAASFSTFRGYMPFPAGLIHDLHEPLAAYLAADLALPPEYRMGDLVLLNQSIAARTAVATSSGWIVAERAGLRVRYVRRAGGGLELGSNPEWSGPRQTISLHGRDILEIVRARIVWIGRETETSRT